MNRTTTLVGSPLPRPRTEEQIQPSQGPSVRRKNQSAPCADLLLGQTGNPGVGTLALSAAQHSTQGWGWGGSGTPGEQGGVPPPEAGLASGEPLHQAPPLHPWTFPIPPGTSRVSVGVRKIRSGRWEAVPACPGKEPRSGAGGPWSPSSAPRRASVCTPGKGGVSWDVAGMSSLPGGAQRTPEQLPEAGAPGTLPTR